MSTTLRSHGPASAPRLAGNDVLPLTRLAEPGNGAVVGDFRFTDGELARTAEREGPLAAWMAAFERFGTDAPNKVQGNFAVALCDRTGRIFLAVDRFAIRTLCYRTDGAAVIASERADTTAGAGAELDPQGLYEYLYFHVIPAPRTIFRNVQRLVAGHCATVRDRSVTVARWWKPAFEEHHRVRFDELRDAFRSRLRDAVARNVDGVPVGCFLSGGTDSSTVAGMLGQVTGEPARTFSIGFDAPGYDEMEYARIAARHFRTDHHEYYVTPEDLVAAVPSIAAAYDQPFGNSSVVPSYYCAKVAREAGVERLLGGDGGDELFGGNSRYARQRLLGAYERIPAGLRSSALEPLFLGTKAFAHVPLLRKVASYIEQARVPMPDRIQAYNLLERVGIAEVLTPEVLASVATDAPRRQQRDVYGWSAGASLINRMLAFDWRYTLADNDLPKIVGATALAGVQVAFPMLDEEVVDFSLSLHPELKLKGLKLRWFFKEALRGFLPDEILTKKKHGFGLPFGVWMQSDPGLQSLARSSITALAQRGIVRKDFLDRLMAEHFPQHPGYYGELVWVLMVLEQWLRAHASTASPADQRWSSRAASV